MVEFVEVLQPRRSTFGLGSTAFARHYLRYRFLFLFLRLLRCFTSAGVAFLILFYSDKVDTLLKVSGYPIRIPPGLSSLAALRGFSQLVASFFACWHQGILRKPLVSSFPRISPLPRTPMTFCKVFCVFCLVLYFFKCKIVFPTLVGRNRFLDFSYLPHGCQSPFSFTLLRLH